MMNPQEIYNEAIDGPGELQIKDSVNKLMDQKAHAEWLKLPQTEAIITLLENGYRQAVGILESEARDATNEHMRVTLGEQLGFKKMLKIVKNGINKE